MIINWLDLVCGFKPCFVFVEMICKKWHFFQWPKTTNHSMNYIVLRCPKRINDLCAPFSKAYGPICYLRNAWLRGTINNGDVSTAPRNEGKQRRFVYIRYSITEGAFQMAIDEARDTDGFLIATIFVVSLLNSPCQSQHLPNQLIWKNKWALRTAISIMCLWPMVLVPARRTKRHLNFF